MIVDRLPITIMASIELEKNSEIESETEKGGERRKILTDHLNPLLHQNNNTRT